MYEVRRLVPTLAKYLRKDPLKYFASASIIARRVHKLLVHFKYLIKTNKIGIDH